jgi:hypothetical protein
MNWLRSLFRKEVQPEGKTAADIRPGMKYKTVQQILGAPRVDSRVTGADILGRGSSDRRAADNFLYFDKDPKYDYSIRFSRGKVVSLEQYRKPKSSYR